MSTFPPEERNKNTYGYRDPNAPPPGQYPPPVTGPEWNCSPPQNYRRLSVTKNGLACLFWMNLMMLCLCVGAIIVISVALNDSPRVIGVGQLFVQRLEADNSAEVTEPLQTPEEQSVPEPLEPEDPVSEDPVSEEPVSVAEPVSSMPSALSDEEAVDELFAIYLTLNQMQNEGATEEELGKYVVEDSGIMENIPFHMWCLEVAESLKPIQIMLVLVVCGVILCAILGLIGIIMCLCTPNDLVPKATLLVLGAVLLPVVVSNFLKILTVGTAGVAGVVYLVNAVLTVLAVYWWLLFLRRTAIAISHDGLVKEAKTLWHSYLYMIVLSICMGIIVAVVSLSAGNFSTAMEMTIVILFGLVGLLIIYFGLRYAIGSLVILFTLPRAIKRKIEN